MGKKKAKTTKLIPKFELKSIKESIEAVAAIKKESLKITKPPTKKTRLQELKRFQTIVHLEQFKSNPIGSISMHIKNSVEKAEKKELNPV